MKIYQTLFEEHSQQIVDGEIDDLTLKIVGSMKLSVPIIRVVHMKRQFRQPRMRMEYIATPITPFK